MKAGKIVSGILLSTFFIFTMTQCELDNKTLLTDGIWNFKNLTTNSEDETTQDLIFLVKALMTDGTMEFQGDGNYIMDAPLLDEPVTGTWSLIGDDQLILTAEGELPMTNNIETLSKKELKSIQTITDTELNTYSLTFSWGK